MERLSLEQQMRQYQAGEAAVAAKAAGKVGNDESDANAAGMDSHALVDCLPLYFLFSCLLVYMCACACPCVDDTLH